MSRQSRLPPRCPFKRNLISPSIQEPYYPQHHRSPSHSSILDEQPAWLDDLLSEEDSNAKGSLLRRSVSDSVTLLQGLTDSFSGLKLHFDEENSTEDETDNKLESASLYGPNSPRRRGNVAFSENALASALSEYVLQNPMQYVDGSICISGMNYSDLKVNACSSMEESNSEAKNAKRLELELSSLIYHNFCFTVHNYLVKSLVLPSDYNRPILLIVSLVLKFQGQETQ